MASLPTPMLQSCSETFSEVVILVTPGLDMLEVEEVVPAARVGLVVSCCGSSRGSSK